MRIGSLYLGLALIAGLSAPSAFAGDVLTGFDLFQTQPGAFFDATGFGLGIIPMVGRAIGPGVTDTIITHQVIT